MKCKTPEEFMYEFCKITRDCFNKAYGEGEFEKLTEEAKHDIIMHFARRFQHGLKGANYGR